MSSKSRILVSAVVLLASVAAGWIVGSSETPVGATTDPQPPNQTTTASPQARAPASIQEPSLYPELGLDPASEEIRSLLVASKGSKDATRIRSEFMSKLGRDQSLGLDRIRGALKRLEGPALSAERLIVLDSALALTQKKEEVRKLALHELTASVAPVRPDPREASTDEERARALSTTWEMALAKVSLDIYLRLTPDPEQALSGALQGFEAQPDPGVREELATTFLKHQPELKARLDEALQSRGIRLQSREEGDL